MKKLHWLEVADLASAVLGLDDNADRETIEQALYDRFEISLEALGELVEALLPFTTPARAVGTDELFNGFVKDGAFIVKRPASEG